MYRSAGPQIRGGESLCMLRLSNQAVHCQDDRFDLLCALDWNNFQRFESEIPLDKNSTVVADSKAGPMPEVLVKNGTDFQALPLTETAKNVAGGRPNMVLLGRLAAFLNIPLEILTGEIRSRFSGKPDALLNAALSCAETGFAEGLDIYVESLSPVPDHLDKRWMISGNEAAGLGALHAGVRFVAAYPITPASEALEWMAPRLEELNGKLVQAEDELASINMAIGAGYAGVPSLTATSGPGLALMVEGLGLATASETPVTVLNVMRGGPSTGIPTKSEQSDLNIALHGLHGDAPHLVTAALSITDCAFTMAWTVGLTEALQVPAIVLTDQALGQSTGVVGEPRLPEPLQRRTADLVEQGYLRYQMTADGVSPMAIPGQPGNMYTADGLEHDESGKPSTIATDHARGLDKRLNKLRDFDYGPDWGEVHGEGDTAIVCFGSAAGAVNEAVERLNASGVTTKTVCIRLLSPLPQSQIESLLTECRRVIVVEQNHGAQFFHYLKGYLNWQVEPISLARPGPLPLRPGEIVKFVTEQL